MGLLLWPVALLVLLAWSFTAWVAFGLSDWIAGLVGSAFGGILSAELGPWAAWITSSLGNIVQAAIVAVWAVGGLFILSAPIMLRRRRRAEATTAGTEWQPSAPPPLAGERRGTFLPRNGPQYGGGYAGGPAPAPAGPSHGWRRDDDDDDDDKKRRWRDKEAWKRRMEPAMGDLRDLRSIAWEMAHKYRGKKWKKKKDWDD